MKLFLKLFVLLIQCRLFCYRKHLISLKLQFMFQYFVCLHSQTVFAAISNYILSGVQFEWYAATINERYSFASPYLNFEKSSIIDIGSILRDENEAWVGYLRVETAFEYFGCSLMNDNVPSQTLLNSWNTPGICFSVCNGMAKKVFGLNNDKCFCLDDAPSTDIHKPKCDNYNYTNWVAGGGDTFISLYRKIDIKEITPLTNGECFTFFGTTNHRITKWKKCTKSNKCICLKDGRGLPGKIDIGQWHFSWTQNVKTCFELGFTPVTYQDVLNSSLSFVNATTNSWTNIIRSKAIYSYKDYINDSKSKEYAYIKREGTQIYLYFTSNYGSFKQALFERNLSVTVGVSLTLLAVIIAIVAVAVVAVKRSGNHSTCLKSINPFKTFISTSDLHSSERNVYETTQDSTYNEVGDIGTNSTSNEADYTDLQTDQETHDYVMLECHSL